MNISKRYLCWVFLALCFNCLGKYEVEGFHRILPEYQSVRAAVVDKKYRTAYHFQPPMHWINDPNAPLYYKGYYHLLYQYNPYGSTWGNIIWAHSYSIDLINWIPLEPAIYPSEPYDINGAWSGSATILPGNKPVILYTGVDTELRQVQNIAFPKNLSDPLLREWVRPDYNPVIMPNKFMNASAFRDPTTAWLGNDGQWRTVIGHKRRHRGIAELYRSRDLKTWTRAKHPLHSVGTTGMWECPDFFPVSLKGKHGLDLTAMYQDDVKHVLKVSLDVTRFDYYTVGRYIPKRDIYIPENTSPDNSTGLRCDYGNFYASKTFFDEKKKRRISIGWVNESDSKIDDIKKGWAGIMAVPRTVWLDTGARQLLQWPVEELETLRRQKIELSNVPLSLGALTEIHGITSEQADVEVTFALPSLEEAEPFDPTWIDAEQVCGGKDSTVQGGIGPFGLLTLASKNIEEYTAVFFHVFKTPTKPVVLMCAGNKKSSLGGGLYEPSFGGFADTEIQDGNLSLRTLIDHSVIEGYGAGGKIVITSRAYPTLAIGKDAHLYLFNNGSATVNVKRLEAWSMGKALMN